MNFATNRGLPITSVIWAVAIGAALLAAVLQGHAMTHLAPYAAVALVPAALGIVLWPLANREWAQVLIIIAWVGLAIVACLAIAFVPMAVLFLCAPAAASLFERERVIEAMVLSAIFAALVFYAGEFGYFPDPLADQLQGRWGKLAGIAATMTFMLGAMFYASSQSKSVDAEPQTVEQVIVSDPSAGIRNFPRPALQFASDGILMEASPSAMALFELSEDNLDSIDLGGVFAADEATAARIGDATRRAFSSGETQVEDVSLSFAGPGDGTNRRHLSIDVMPNDDRVELYLTDITKHRQAVENLRAEYAGADQAAQEKTLFFAGVSHELRTPLNAIIGFSDMMRSRLFGPLPGKYAEYADLIHDSGQHMLDLIGDVLDLSKVEAGKYELHYGDFDAADVIRSSVKMVRPSADAAEVALNVEIDGHDDLIVEADRKAVRQILLNLLSNAIKFSSKGEHVTVRAATDNGQLYIGVQDNGVGMNARELDMIGKPYVQTKGASMIDARGSGLGLSLVKTLVDLHKGDFKIRSKPGEGTKVDIALPLKRPAAAND